MMGTLTFADAFAAAIVLPVIVEGVNSPAMATDATTMVKRSGPVEVAR